MTINITGLCEACGNEFEYEKEKPSKPNKRTCSTRCAYILRSQTKKTLHEPIEKHCTDCKELFLDTSKKKLIDRCKTCINSLMVKTRYSRGSYKRSDTQNKKLSDTLRQKYAEGWQPLSDEGRKKLSDSMKSMWQTGKMSEMTKLSCQERYGVEHWTKSTVGKYKLSILNTGRVFSESTRSNMSVAASNRVRQNNNHVQRGNGGFREDLGHYVRSNWEANFARITKYLGRSYEYEPVTFRLDETTTYTPDFRIEGVFYEIKGYTTEIAKKKLELFKSKYNHIPFVLIDGEAYSKLRFEYQDKVFWEGK